LKIFGTSLRRLAAKFTVPKNNTCNATYATDRRRIIIVSPCGMERINLRNLYISVFVHFRADFRRHLYSNGLNIAIIFIQLNAF